MDAESVETVELAYHVYEASDCNPDKCPILFLHGLFWNKYMLKELADALSEVTKRKVYCLDLRCHDQSPFREQFSTDIMAEDVKRFIQDRKLEKVSFVCHSISCTVAYLVLLDKPEIVEKVVMIDQAPFAEYKLEVFNKDVYPQFATQKRLLNSLDPSISLAAAKRKLRCLSEEAKTEAHKIFYEKAAYELIKVNNQFKWKTDHQFLIDYAKVLFTSGKSRGRSDHEILLIRCEDSARVTDSKFQNVLKYNPNAKLKTISDTTHLLMFEKPEEFLEAVREFLS